MKLKAILLGTILAASASSAFAEVCNIRSDGGNFRYDGQFCTRGPSAFRPVGDIIYQNMTGKAIRCVVTVNHVNPGFPDSCIYLGNCGGRPGTPLALKFGNEAPVKQGSSLNPFQIAPNGKVEFKIVQWVVPSNQAAPKEESIDVRDNMHKISCEFIG